MTGLEPPQAHPDEAILGVFKSDYPAAHSMDTEWYAVDEEGQVAKFYSGETGGVPAEAVRNDYRDGFWVDMPVTSEFVPFPFPFLCREHNKTEYHKAHCPQHEAKDLRSWSTDIYFLKDLERLPAEHRNLFVQSDDFFINKVALPEALIRSLHKNKLCYACGSFERENPASKGIFEYCIRNEWSAGDWYGLFMVPTKPIKLDELANLVDTNQLAKVKVAGSFAQTPFIQPFDLFECDHRGQNYFPLGCSYSVSANHAQIFNLLLQMYPGDSLIARIEKARDEEFIDAETYNEFVRQMNEPT